MRRVTKSELEEYIHVKREVRLLREDLQGDALMTMDTVAGSKATFPYVARTFTIRGIDQRRIERLQRRLARKEVICERVEDFIDAVEDSEMFMLLKLRFLIGLSWPQVMRRIDCKLSPEAARKKVERFLEKNL